MKKISLVATLLFILNGCGNIKTEVNKMIIEVNNKELIVDLEDNSASRKLLEKLKEKNIIIDAHEYGEFEKVGDLGFDLPTHDEKINTKAGDLMLYQGNKITLFYNNNSWSYTKLGKIVNVDKKELEKILGKKDVKLVLKLK